MHKNRVHCPDAHQIMAFHAAAGVEHQNDKALAFRIEIGMSGNVPAPIVGNPVGRVTQLQVFRCEAFPQRCHLVFMGLRFKPKRFHDLIEAGKDRGIFVHGWFSLRLCGGLTTVTVAGVIGGGAVAKDAARVLPNLAVLVPVEADLRKKGCDFPGLPLWKLNPNPFADNLSHAAQERCFVVQQV